LHLELFFRKASDEEARLWISRKQVIAWGIINELAVEIEKLESVTVGDCDELQSLKVLIEKMRQEHQSNVQELLISSKEQAENAAKNSEAELTQIKTSYEATIESIKNEHFESIEKVQGELQATKEHLQDESQKLQKLNTEHLLVVQKS
jgi:gas vesicle protein